MHPSSAGQVQDVMLGVFHNWKGVTCAQPFRFRSWLSYIKTGVSSCVYNIYCHFKLCLTISVVLFNSCYVICSGSNDLTLLGLSFSTKDQKLKIFSLNLMKNLNSNVLVSDLF